MLLKSAAEFNSNKLLFSTLRQTMLAQCALYRQNFRSTILFMHQWVENNSDYQLNQKIDEYKTVVVSKEYNEINQVKDNEAKIKGYTNHNVFELLGNNTKENWRNISMYGCTEFEKTILIPEKHCKEISPITFYYVLLACKQNPNITKVYVNIQTSAEDELRALNAMCAVGFLFLKAELKTFSLGNVQIVCYTGAGYIGCEPNRKWPT